MRVLLGLLALLALALLPVVAPWTQFVLTIALAQGFAALGVAILLRGGLISLGHAMYVAIGAYTAAFLGSRLGVSDFAALLLVATLVSALAGLVFGLFLIRYRAIFFAMLNLAVSMVIFSLLSKLYAYTGGSDGMRVATPSVFGQILPAAAFARVLFYVALALMIGLGAAVQRYLASPLGHALSAVRSNEIRLEYLGVPVWLVLLIAYALSAALAGLGGAITAAAVGHVEPELAFWTASGHLVLMAVLGGIGGIAGPFIGAIFLEVLHSFAVGYAAEAWNMFVGITLLIVIFVLPAGLYGLIARRREAEI